MAKFVLPVYDCFRCKKKDSVFDPEDLCLECQEKVGQVLFTLRNFYGRMTSMRLSAGYLELRHGGFMRRTHLGV